MHDLLIENGEVAIAWADEVPWHRMGQQSDGLMTSEQALNMARLNWKVRKEQTYVKIDNEFVEVPSTFATVRGQQEGTGSVILTRSGKTVGPRYTPWQNIDGFDFIDDLINDGEAHIEVAGALGNGERVWILARLPTSIKLSNNDYCAKYILISNSHDGSGAIRIMPTMIRVVCANTLGMAMKQKETNKFVMRHTSNARNKVEEAKEILGWCDLRLNQLGEDLVKLQDIEMTLDEMKEYFEDSLGLVRDAKGDLSTKATNILSEVVACLDHPTNNVDDMRGTAWAAYNALTYYVDHIATIDNTGFVNSKKRESALMGSSSKKKEKGLELILKVGV